MKARKSMSVSKGTIVRTVVLILSLINQLCTVSGHPILPFSDKELDELVSTLITAAMAIIVWWKNNSFTQNAIEKDNSIQGFGADNDLIEMEVTLEEAEGE